MNESKESEPCLQLLLLLAATAGRMPAAPAPVARVATCAEELGSLPVLSLLATSEAEARRLDEEER